MFGAGIIEIDLHGCNLEQAKTRIAEQIRKAGASTYRIRCIHGSRWSPYPKYDPGRVRLSERAESNPDYARDE